VPEQNHQDTELAVAERHDLALAVPQAPGVEVELPAVETAGTNALRSALLYLGPAPTQHGGDAGEQLARAERFGLAKANPRSSQM